MTSMQRLCFVATRDLQVTRIAEDGLPDGWTCGWPTEAGAVRNVVLVSIASVCVSGRGRCEELNTAQAWEVHLRWAACQSRPVQNSAMGPVAPPPWAPHQPGEICSGGACASTGRERPQRSDSHSSNNPVVLPRMSATALAKECG